MSGNGEQHGAHGGMVTGRDCIAATCCMETPSLPRDDDRVAVTAQYGQKETT